MWKAQPCEHDEPRRERAGRRHPKTHSWNDQRRAHNDVAPRLEQFRERAARFARGRPCGCANHLHETDALGELLTKSSQRLDQSRDRARLRVTHPAHDEHVPESAGSMVIVHLHDHEAVRHCLGGTRWRYIRSAHRFGRCSCI
jgi:hypothetical protein